MDLDTGYGEQYEAFRKEVKAFLAENWSPQDKNAEASKSEQKREFCAKAIDAGYLLRSIPRKYGGSEQELDVTKNTVISEEFSKAKAPRNPRDIGFSLLVPTLLECGENWLKEKFVPPTVSGEIRWCQGYSEPGAGSDLASVQTRAELDGDEWVINGQKIWTSTDKNADYMFALVRTEPDLRKHDGISYLLINMNQPGIDVRPLKQMTGNAGFSEVFLTDARTPKDWIVGKRGEGWKISRTTLKHERSAVRGNATAMLGPLVALVKNSTIDGRPALEHPLVRQKLAEIEGSMLASECALHYRGTKALKGENPGRIALMSKLIGTDIFQEVVKLAIDVVGDDALLAGRALEGVSLGFQLPRNPAETAEWVSGFMGSLGAVSAGGSSNIQRNVIAERGLGLPRDAAAHGSK